MENWCNVGFSDAYEVSDHGNVRRSRDCPKTGRKAGDLLRADILAKGHRLYSFGINGKRVRWQAHRLVITAFGPAMPDGRTIVAHNDGNPANNHISNLRWATYKENTADRIAHGTDMRGSGCKQSLLTETQVAFVLAQPQYRGFVTDMAKRFGVHRTTIGKIIAGKNWLHVQAAHSEPSARDLARR